MKVSVIIPEWGDTPYLSEALKALDGQVFRDFEIIRCAPPAGTSDAGAARNAGLDRVQGEWISFVDADDLPSPEMLESAVAVGESGSYDVVVFNAEEFDAGTGFVTPLPLRLDAGLGDDVRLISFGSCVWNKLFRTSYLRAKGIRFQELPRSNDLAFTAEALARTDRIAVLPRVLYRYRINRGGLQATKAEAPDCWREALAETRKRLDRAGLLPRYSIALSLLEKRVSADNLPGGPLSPRRILHSIRSRGFLNFLKHAWGWIAG